MPKITYVSYAGAATTIEAAVGMTVMRAAIMHGIPGIDADCGGSCACATCHVIVDPTWASRLQTPDRAEAETLALVGDPDPNSRLSCQIGITPALDGLVVQTPARQG